jgi:hypothetical protein
MAQRRESNTFKRKGGSGSGDYGTELIEVYVKARNEIDPIDIQPGQFPIIDDEQLACFSAGAAL